MKTNPVEHTDFYFNAGGLMVLTEAYHLERGYCCGNGCLHCPYDFESVPEPRKTILQQQSKLQLPLTADKDPLK